MQEGTVKFFNETKGFGFIQSATDGKDVFVHISGLTEEIREGDRVTFSLAEGKRGVNAVNVKVM